MSFTFTPADVSGLSASFTSGPSETNFVTTDNGSATTFGDIDISGIGSVVADPAEVSSSFVFRQRGTLDLSSVPPGTFIDSIRIRLPRTLVLTMDAAGAASASVGFKMRFMQSSSLEEEGSDTNNPAALDENIVVSGAAADRTIVFGDFIEELELFLEGIGVMAGGEIIIDVAMGSPLSPNFAAVASGAGASASASFQLTMSGWEMELITSGSLSITAVNPAIGGLAGGDEVEIVGTGFDPLVEVLFDQLFALSVVWNSATSLTVVTPPHAEGVVTVTVTNPDGTYDEGVGLFEYADADSPFGAPFITSVTPDDGTMAGGTAVTIVGGGFNTGATVLFGETPATSVVVVSPTQITCVTPAHPVETVDVKVVT